MCLSSWSISSQTERKLTSSYPFQTDSLWIWKESDFQTIKPCFRHSLTDSREGEQFIVVCFDWFLSKCVFIVHYFYSRACLLQYSIIHIRNIDEKFFFISFVCKQQRSIIFCYHFSIHNWKLHQNKTDMFYFISADVCLSRAMNESRKNFFMPPTSVGIKQWSRLFSRYCSNSSLCKCCVHFFSS